MWLVVILLRLLWKVSSGGCGEIWGVDKVILVKKGLFMIRFKTTEKRDQPLKDHIFFDSKPVIIKPCH